MIYAPVAQAIVNARAKIALAREQAGSTQPTLLHDAFNTLRLAVDDLTDAVESLYRAAEMEEEGR